MGKRRMGPMAASPMALWMTGFEAARLGLEAQAVIGMRMMGMAGFWAMPPSEMARMVAEKQAAFARAGVETAAALARGANASAALRKGIAPLRTETAANVKRLGRHARR